MSLAVVTAARRSRRPAPGKCPRWWRRAGWCGGLAGDLGLGSRKVDGHIYALGPGDIWSTPADLVRWADNYRTGNVGEPALLMRGL
jgi:hypothetical protein